MEMVHGVAGGTTFGAKKNLWSPADAGSRVRSVADRLAPLEPYRDYLTIVSNTDCRNAEAFTPPEIGGDHFRSAAVFLTQSHPHQTQGSDVLRRHVARSDLRAGRRARTRRSRRCSCASRTSTSRAAASTATRAPTPTRSAGRSPTEPLPMIRDPRAVFDQLFGVGATPEARARRRRKDKSLLDWVMASAARAEGERRHRRSRAARRLSRRRARDRAAHPEGRGAQHERRGARAAVGARSASPTPTTTTCG